MFHYLVGEIKDFGDIKILKTKDFGLQVIYNGNKSEGEFFLFPYIEQNIHSIIYFAFDNIDQRSLFEKLYKLPGIGVKTAYIISFIDKNKLKKAVEETDINFFKQIPGIGPKSAKRLIVELKSNLTKTDLQIDDTLWKKIKQTMKNLGYDSGKIEELLKKCDIQLKEENLQQIIKYLLDNL